MNKPTNQMEGNQPIAHQLGDKNGATENLTQRVERITLTSYTFFFVIPFECTQLLENKRNYLKNNAEITLQKVTWYLYVSNYWRCYLPTSLGISVVDPSSGGLRHGTPVPHVRLATFYLDPSSVKLITNSVLSKITPLGTRNKFCL